MLFRQCGLLLLAKIEFEKFLPGVLLYNVMIHSLNYDKYGKKLGKGQHGVCAAASRTPFLRPVL